MRRRDMIAGTGAALLASPSMAGESLSIPAELPEGTREIARFANVGDKRRLLCLTDRPPNYATTVDVFSGIVTPNDRFFVRYHMEGVPSAADMSDWSLSIAGDAVDRPVRLKFTDLQDMPTNEFLAVCQCAGNRRGLIDPHVAGVQWPDGAMGCALWRGPRLSDILKAAGIKASALEVWFGGADKPPVPGMPPFRKSLPIEKAMDGDTIVAMFMNNAPLPQLNGFPVRLVVPGWIGSYWLKHLTSIEVSTRSLANFWMQTAYRVPAGLFPVEHPFVSQASESSVPLTELVVNSLIADPLEGTDVERSGFTISGMAWDRGVGINRVELSLDGGHTWQDALLDAHQGLYAFRRFSLGTGLLRRGVYRLMSRATSVSGERQPERMKTNAGGYQNNVPRAIAVVAV